MRSEARLRARGRVRLGMRVEHGYRDWCSPNLVLDGIVRVAMKALAGHDVALAHVQYGDSNTAPDPDQTGAQGTFGTVNVDGASFSAGECHATFVIDELANAVSEIHELVLVAADGTAVARVVVNPPVPKSAKVRIEGQWDLLLELA